MASDSGRRDSNQSDPAGTKFIIGVPVLPGLPSQTAIEKDPVDPGTTTPIEEAPAVGPPPERPNDPKWTLHHVDFIPALVKGAKNEEFERFRTLVEKANMWSQENPQALVFQCETMTWTTMDRPLYSDNSITHKSMHSGKSSKVFRGLRLWYLVLEEIFYDKSASPGPFKIGYVNYNPESKNDTFETLTAKLNDDLFKGAIPGKIIKTETLHVLSDCSDPDMCYWKEQPDNNRDYYSFMRVFYMTKSSDPTKQGDVGRSSREFAGKKLGIRDFLPQYDQRSPHNQGYEVYADMWRRAARWIFLNPHLRIINMQSVFFKLKKEGVDPTSTLYERCYHREHGSSYGSMGHTKTEYVQVLRVIFSQPVQQAKNKEEEPARKMYYKSFTPVKIKKVVPLSSGTEEQEPMENNFEDLRHTEEKINVWLNHTGAKIFGVESIPTRLVTGGQEILGPEATYVYNDREKNIGREYWRYHIRIYLEGEYKEIPVHWSAKVVEQSTIGTS